MPKATTLPTFTGIECADADMTLVPLEAILSAHVRLDPSAHGPNREPNAAKVNSVHVASRTGSCSSNLPVTAPQVFLLEHFLKNGGLRERWSVEAAAPVLASALTNATQDFAEHALPGRCLTAETWPKCSAEPSTQVLGNYRKSRRRAARAA